ncbi:tetratricopeptide repeat protein [Hamadaea tsunoensis]|uniref:tetratricopeptide repeat protein n=1 Tax=Hamadaea tsunoensis TaxID=53368 RepID=UPI000413C79F|nr:tetratricopeptide repeat protein [Hamadaea tsunoensis]
MGQAVRAVENGRVWMWVGLVSGAVGSAAALAVEVLGLWKDGLSPHGQRVAVLLSTGLVVLGLVAAVVGWWASRRRADRADDAVWRMRVATLLRELPGGGLPRLSQLADSDLGATATRYTAAGTGWYVPRHGFDERLRAALLPAGPPFPFVIVWGDSKAGKSRTAVEAVRAVFGAADPEVLLPVLNRNALEELMLLQPPLEVGVPAVVWLDNLSPVQLGQLTGPLLEWLRARAVVVGTLTTAERAKVLAAPGEVGAVAVAALAKGGAAGEEFHLPFAASAPELAEASRLYPDEKISGSIGETLIAGVALVDRYRNGHVESPMGQAVVRIAVDLRRAGLARPVREAELTALLPAYAAEITVAAPSPHAFEAGIAWARTPVSSQVALLTAVADDPAGSAWSVLPYLEAVDEGQREHEPRPVPERLWQPLIGMVEAVEAYYVGLAAYFAGQHDAARDGLRKAMAADDPDTTSAAAFNLGVLLVEQGDIAGARAAYRLAADSSHPEAAPMAAYNLGTLLVEQGDVTGALEAYEVAVDSDHPEIAPAAAVVLGTLLVEQGDVTGALEAYEVAINSDDPEMAPTAAVHLGKLLREEAPPSVIQEIYQLAIDSDHSEMAPTAAYHLGELLEEQGDVPGALAAYQRAIDSNHPEMAPMAALGLWTLLTARGDTAGAQTAYQRAIDRNEPEIVSISTIGLAGLLTEQGDMAGAQAAYQQVIDSNEPEMVPLATFSLAVLLQEQGDTAGARIAYQRVIDSNDPDKAPTALFNMGMLLSEQGDVAGAQAAYQLAVDSNHLDASPRAANNLGLMLEDQGDVAGAQAAFHMAIDSKHSEAAPAAAINLGELLSKQGDTAGAQALYQMAIDSEHSEAAAMAAINLGELLNEQGDTAGARTAYQRAIDSNHPELAPMAARRLAEIGADDETRD